MFGDFEKLYQFLHDPMTGMFAALSLWLVWQIVKIWKGGGTEKHEQISANNSMQLKRISDCVSEIKDIKHEIETSREYISREHSASDELLIKYTQHTQRTLDICVELLNIIKYTDTKSASMKILDKEDHILDILRQLHSDIQVIKDRKE